MPNFNYCIKHRIYFLKSIFKKMKKEFKNKVLVNFTNKDYYNLSLLKI